jgi:hypothetical protein
MMSKLHWWQFKKKEKLREQIELEYYLRHKEELELLKERIKSGKKEGIYRKIRTGEDSDPTGT